jgi:hypothetical protein
MCFLPFAEAGTQILAMFSFKWLVVVIFHFALSMVNNIYWKDTSNSSVNCSVFCDVTLTALDCIIWLKFIYLKFVVGQADKPDKFEDGIILWYTHQQNLISPSMQNSSGIKLLSWDVQQHGLHSTGLQYWLYASQKAGVLLCSEIIILSWQ